MPPTTDRALDGPLNSWSSSPHIIFGMWWSVDPSREEEYIGCRFKGISTTAARAWSNKPESLHVLRIVWFVIILLGIVHGFLLAVLSFMEARIACSSSAIPNDTSYRLTQKPNKTTLSLCTWTGPIRCNHSLRLLWHPLTTNHIAVNSSSSKSSVFKS